MEIQIIFSQNIQIKLLDKILIVIFKIKSQNHVKFLVKIHFENYLNILLNKKYLICDKRVFGKKVAKILKIISTLVNKFINLIVI